MVISQSGWWINKPKMRSRQSNWLAASLFPLKIYTLLAGIILLCWHANLPLDQTDLRSSGINPNPCASRVDQVWLHAATDFAYVTHFARLGYFFAQWF
jgi:hypothetical protein